MTDDTTDNKIVALADFQKQQQTAGTEVCISERAVALAFVEKYRDDLRFDPYIGKWFRWDGQIWGCARTKMAFDFAGELAGDMAASEKAKIRVSTGRASFAAGVERIAQARPVFEVTVEYWDQDLYLAGVPAGTVDLHSGELRPARREDYITKRTAIAPADTADCPLWRRFLHEATNGDTELVGFLKRYAGYALTGDIKEHALVFCSGPGGNGKGVFQNTIGSIMGDYRRTAAMTTFTATFVDQHPTELAMLRGARLVTASETEEGRAWAESRIKQLTGGDRIAARFMRQDHFEFTPQFKLLFIGNHNPTLRNVDDAVRRRFNIVPFVHKPAQIDLDLVVFCADVGVVHPIPDGGMGGTVRSFPGRMICRFSQRFSGVVHRQGGALRRAAEHRITVRNVI